MNAVYRVVWNAATGQWVVASELAKGRKKKSSVGKLAAMTLALAGIGAPAVFASDAPSPDALQCKTNEIASDGACVASAPITPFFADGGGDDNGNTSNVAIGAGAVTGNVNSVAIGQDAKANNIANVAIGQGANTAGSNAIATGYNATANGNYAITYGGGASAIGARTTALGTDAQASSANATAVGNGANAAGNASVALGNNSGVDATSGGAVAIGSGAKVNANMGNAISLGNDSVADRTRALSIGSTGNERQIVHVAKGFQDTDAVNVSQLKPVIGAIGGGATIDPTTGVVTGPTYSIGGNTYNNVGAALTNIDGRTTVNEGDIANLKKGTLGLVTQADPNAVVNVATASGGTSVNFAGTAGARQLKGVAAGVDDTDGVNVKQLRDAGIVDDGGNVANVVVYDGAAKDSVTLGGASGTRITNVAAGDVSASSTDAVNGSQLNATNLKVEENTSKIDNLVDTSRYFKANGKSTTDDAVATGEGAVAIGSAANAQFADSVAIGAGATTTWSNAVAVGNGSTASEEGVAMGHGASATNTNAIAIGSNALGNLRSVAIGANTTTTDSAVAIGEGAMAMGTGSMALGAGAQVLGAGSVALGSASGTARNNVVAVGGVGSERQIVNVAEGTTLTDAVNVSQLNKAISGVSAGDTRYFKADGKNDDTDDAIVTGSNSVAIGAGSVATRDNTVDVGNRQITGVVAGKEDTDAVNVSQLKATGLIGDDGSMLDAVVYDAGSNRGSVTFGGTAGTRLTNVMAGLIAPGSMDAVNGSQLWDVQDQVNKLGDRVTNIEVNGGGSGPVTPVDPGKPVPEGGTRDPHFASNGDATKPAQATGDNAAAVGTGSVADRDNTVSVGSKDNERQVTNVAAGTQETDAANWGQVQDALRTANSYTDDRFNTLDRRIDKVGRKANAGVASALAAASMPQAYAPGLNSVGVGVGSYGGQSAIAIGASTISESGRWVFKVNGTSSTNGEKGVGAGAAMVW